MKWITHQTGAALGAMVLGLPAHGIAAACAGAVFPDVIDQKLSGMGRTRAARQRLFNKIHRGASHWLGWWLAVFLAPFFVDMPMLARDALSGFGMGAASHVLMDMLTPQGVPLTPFSRKGKLAMPICSTGHMGEYVFLATMLICGAFYFQDALAPVLDIACGQ